MFALVLLSEEAPETNISALGGFRVLLPDGFHRLVGQP